MCLLGQSLREKCKNPCPDITRYDSNIKISICDTLRTAIVINFISGHIHFRTWDNFYSCLNPEFIFILDTVCDPHAISVKLLVKYRIRNGQLSYVEVIHYSYPMSRFDHYPYFMCKHNFYLNQDIVFISPVPIFQV